MSEALSKALGLGLQQLGLDLSPSQIRQLLDYLSLLQKWSKVYNLTAVRDPADMLTHHVLDSLAVIAPLKKQLAKLAERGDGGTDVPVRLLDVGSGAGLPGAVIAICCPELDVSCVDTVSKKAAFIQQAAMTLALPNLHGIHTRVENLCEPGGLAPFDVVCSRAFASLADFTRWSKTALAERGVWLGMKGKHPADEMAALPPDVQVFHVEQLNVPGLDAERCIVWMRSVVGA